jgi:hypothetical protein
MKHTKSAYANYHSLPLHTGTDPMNYCLAQGRWDEWMTTTMCWTAD